MRQFYPFLVLAIAASCAVSVSRQPRPGMAAGAEAVTIFLTGYELGQLRPCGCSAGQLGGFEKRAAILSSVPRSRRLVVDAGHLVSRTDQQGRIKLEIMLEALRRLQYDVLVLQQQELQLMEQEGLVEQAQSHFALISASEPNMSSSYSKRFRLKDRTVVLTVAAFDAQKQAIGLLPQLLRRPTDSSAVGVNVLLADHCDAGSIDAIIRTGLVDCLVCPPVADEPQRLRPAKAGGPLVVSSGRYGRYVLKVEVTGSGEDGRPRLGFGAVPVLDTLPAESSLVELYRDYQRLLEVSELLVRHPRYPLADGLRYVGSETCRGCHGYEYSKWSLQRHAHAYQTLEKVGSQYDPECVVCHVVGFDYEGGFITPRQTPNLKDVGCENCHGPGSAHVATAGAAAPAEPQSSCEDCHTPENSVHYAGNEAEYFEKIVHWPEPNAPANVK